jgi:hypothetical protein
VGKRERGRKRNIEKDDDAKDYCRGTERARSETIPYTTKKHDSHIEPGKD